MKLKCIVIAFFILPIFFGYSQNIKEIKPLEKKHPVVLITGENHVFYQLNKNNPAEYTISGADSIIIVTRKQLSDNDHFKPYTISYRFNELPEIEYVSGELKPDHNAQYLNKSLMKRPSTQFKNRITVTEQIDKLTVYSKRNNEMLDLNVYAYYGKEKKKLKPVTKNQTSILKTGKSSKYYKLNSSIPTIIDVNEPGKLIVYTRKRLSKNDSSGYTFSYKDKYSNIKTIHVKTVTKSKESIYKSLYIKEVPSGYTKTIIDIPKKLGQITFFSEFPVDARFLYQKEDTEMNWKIIHPSDNKEFVILNDKETKKVLKYHRISETESLSFDVTGPKTVRLLSRGEFSYEMHSNNDYEIVLREGKTILNTFKLSCFRSSKVEYLNNNEMVPGTIDVIYLNIPEGKHSYTLSVNNNNKTALVRVSSEIKK
jgi:hypothetical protein